MGFFAGIEGWWPVGNARMDRYSVCLHAFRWSIQLRESFCRRNGRMYNLGADKSMTCQKIQYLGKTRTSAEALSRLQHLCE